MTKPFDTSYFRKGDYQKVAHATGVSRGMVSRVANGLDKSAPVMRALEALYAERQKQEEENIKQLCEDIKQESVTDFKTKS